MTPEGKVKQVTKNILEQYTPQLYYHMPVQAGYGKPSLDFTGAINGHAFAIETKVPGNGKKSRPTEQQDDTINDMRIAGIEVFVFHGYLDEINQLRAWLEAHSGR